MQDTVERTFQKSWNFVRTLTIDLLNSLSESDLLWSPGQAVGPFWKQIRHIGRVQEDYMNAFTTKQIYFSCENKHYRGGPNRLMLIDYLQKLDDTLFTKLQKLDLNESIDWFGEHVDISEHLSRMISHETLHHGQFIVYFQLLGKQYPNSWSVWGILIS